MRKLFIRLIISCILLMSVAAPAYSARDTDSFDGNIFPIYAGNGSLVPPPSSLDESLRNNRAILLLFYLDDSATSKSFAPVVSGIKLLWGSSIDIIPLTIDEFLEVNDTSPKEASYYWHGNIPQTVVINGQGNVVFDQDGQVSIDDLNQAISLATGLQAPESSFTVKSYNEYNSEASREAYISPRG